METIEITKDEYNQLQARIVELEDEVDDMREDVTFLRCLESQGVDNWDGYDYAREEFNEIWGDDDE